MSAADWGIILLLTLGVIFALRHYLKGRKNGCSGCAGGCQGCAEACRCAESKQQKKETL